jgi:hypothetical protein
MVKEEFDKLLKVRFIRLVEMTEWVSPVVLAFKKMASYGYVSITKR